MVIKSNNAKGITIAGIVEGKHVPKNHILDLSGCEDIIIMSKDHLKTIMGIK